MKRNLLVSGLAAAALFASTSFLSAQSGSVLFGLTFFGNQLVTVDPATGTATAIGSLGQTVNGYGLANRNGQLYTFNPNKNVIQQISPVSGRVLRDINIGVSGLQGEGDLAFRPSDGVGFLVSALNSNAQPTNDFYTFDVVNGTSSRLGSTGVAIDALAFNSSGKLYGMAKGDSSLYIIDLTTGAATVAGDLGITPGSPIGAMSFDSKDVLYASIDDRLYTINTASGAATPVSSNVLDFGVSSVSGLVFAPGVGTLRNISGRAAVGSAEKVAIAGFIIRGTGTKTVVLRGIGPSLPNVSGVLADPMIELYDSAGHSLATNDNWMSDSTAAAQISNLGLAPANPKDSALFQTLNPGAYTMILRAADGGTGIGLAEIYDAEPGSTTSFGNISSRGNVTSGDNVLIGGLIVGGTSSQRVVARAIGPDLASYNVPGPLQDPMLQIYDANGNSLGINDNFATAGQAAELATNKLTPGDPRDSALIMDFAPGNYTAIVTGNGGNGIALVEFFNLTTANQ